MIMGQSIKMYFTISHYFIIRIHTLLYLEFIQQSSVPTMYVSNLFNNFFYDVNIDEIYCFRQFLSKYLYYISLKSVIL